MKAVRAAARQLDRVQSDDLTAIGPEAAHALRDRLQQLVRAPTT